MAKYIVLPTSTVIAEFYRKPNVFQRLSNGVKGLVLPILLRQPISSTYNGETESLLSDVIYLYENEVSNVTEEEFHRNVLELSLILPLLENELKHLCQSVCLEQVFVINPNFECFVGGDIILEVGEF